MPAHTLTVADFARLFGAAESGLPAACRELIAQTDWGYDWLDGAALDDLVTALLERIRRKEFSVVVEGDKTRWVRGWGENLNDFVASKGDLAALSPKYVRPDMPVRLFRRLAKT